MPFKVNCFRKLYESSYSTNYSLNITLQQNKLGEKGNCAISENAFQEGSKFSTARLEANIWHLG